MPTPTPIDPAIAAYVKDLFHQLEVRLYTQINTYHIELRQELLKIVNSAIDNAIEDSLSNFRIESAPSGFFDFITSQQLPPGAKLEIHTVNQNAAFPTPTTPWDLPQPSNTFSAFPPARIVSPIEERKEEEKEKITTQEEGGEKETSDILSAIEKLIDQKLQALTALTATSKPTETGPQFTTAEESPTYSWGNDYDPYAYARSVNDVFNSQS